MAFASSAAVPMEVAPYRLSGTVYGALLNHRSALDTMGEAASKAPYQAPPKAPVLYVKPRNTLALTGDPIMVPSDVPELEVGACLGMVIGSTACRLNVANALSHIAGYIIVNDVSVPHSQYYRPSIRYKARDGFCPLGPRVVPSSSITNPDALDTRVYIDGKLHQGASTADLIRPVSNLLVDVTDFMTLSPGDILAVGVAAPAPRARAGQEVAIEISGLGRLVNHFVAGGA